MNENAGIILAGGDGTRLRALTRLLASGVEWNDLGDHRRVRSTLDRLRWQPAPT